MGHNKKQTKQNKEAASQKEQKARLKKISRVGDSQAQKREHTEASHEEWAVDFCACSCCDSDEEDDEDGERGRSRAVRAVSAPLALEAEEAGFRCAGEMGLLDLASGDWAAGGRIVTRRC